MITTDVIRHMLRESAETKLAAQALADDIATFAQWMSETYDHDGKVILFGNGGSLCDAAHIAAELVGRYKRERRGLPAIALVEPALLTALGNDYDYSTVFTRQVQAWTKPGDLVVGISTSGKSVNVLAALRVARRQGAKTVALTGANGESMREVANLVLAVPSTNTPRIQECHIAIGHIVCELVEQCLEEQMTGHNESRPPETAWAPTAGEGD
ncbi:MAG TPA: SIS domain-containing protein [Thermoguttaceae bacterium]|nr:SIS domain-containing protein [Thermoguttaceae bacterium]